MTDSRIVTGNRNDLLVDTSRCLRMRFSESNCQRCKEICPHGAVTLVNGLAIHAEQCHGCLLCTVVCPVGALEQNMDFSSCLAQLSMVAEPVLGCIRTKENSNATLACMGGLSEEHLLALYHTLSGRLTLNLSLCRDCTNSPMVQGLKKRLATIVAAGLSSGTCRIVLAEAVKDIHFRDTSVDRRSFFKSFGTALFKNAVDILSNTTEQIDQRTEYAEKRVPVKRDLLNKTRAKLSPELADLSRKQFDSSISFDESCILCYGCVAICPTGALQTDLSDYPATFEQLLCTGCGLCTEFCLDGAVRNSAVR